MRKRTLEAIDYRAGHYFRQLESFLGTMGIERRLASVDLALQTESDVYLRNWVLPRLSWWLGIREAREIIQRNGSFRRGVTLLMERPLQTAIKLSKFHRTMPDWKKEEFRSRILSKNFLDPTLFEIDCSAHFWQLGYDIEWFESQSDLDMKSSEFIAKGNGHEFEVECKAKQVDAGRRIERDLFYKTVDQLLPIIQKKELSGIIFLTVPSRLPRKTSWRDEAVQMIEERFVVGSGTIRLDSGEILDFDLRPADGSQGTMSDIAHKVDVSSHPFVHYAIIGAKNGNAITDPVVFRLESLKPGTFLDNILISLRKAESKFTGNRASLISCMLPEIDSFEGLEIDSAIHNMTCIFFENYARDFVNAVSYVSEVRREVEGAVILSDMPFLTYRNHKYDFKYGPDIPITN